MGGVRKHTVGVSASATSIRNPIIFFFFFNNGIASLLSKMRQRSWSKYTRGFQNLCRKKNEREKMIKREKERQKHSPLNIHNSSPSSRTSDNSILNSYCVCNTTSYWLTYGFFVNRIIRFRSWRHIEQEPNCTL